MKDTKKKNHSNIGSHPQEEIMMRSLIIQKIVIAKYTKDKVHQSGV